MDDLTPERIWVCLPEIFDALGFWYDKPQAGAVEYARADRIAALEAENARLRVLHSAMTAYLVGEPSNPPVTGLSKVDIAAITPAAPPDTTPPPDRLAAPMPAPGSA